MKLTFLGATETVTGTKYLLNYDSKKILITHTHIDHSGYLPLLVKNGYRVPIYTTQGKNAAVPLKEKIENQFHWNCILPTYLQTVTL